ncbi:MAG TPA: 5'-nucleotidase C-terminal domain-containing protein [Selenomonadales bacterium]|nr:5'-nucleotidase C-terminal domain-containing protein [Selenomonadales bacterium]
MRFWSKTARLMLTLAMAMALVLPVGPAGAAEGQVGFARIDILAVNDFHGALVEAGKNPGAAKLGGYLLAEKAKNPGGTLILSAGDMFQGTPDSNMGYGKAVVRVMNAIGFDAMVLGNHEFDWGLDQLKARIGESKFPYLAANIIDNNTGKPVDFVQPTVMIEKNGVKIGIIGIVTPETAYTTSPQAVSGFTFGDPATVVNALAPALRQQGAQVIVVLAHLASDMDKSGEVTGDAADLARAASGVDVIISAHSHKKVAGIVNGVAIVQGSYNGRNVGKVGLVYAKAEGRVVAKIVDAGDLVPDKLTADARIKTIVDENERALKPVKNVILGRTARNLSHDKMQLSLLGQWTADVMREVAGADMAFGNGGGLRTGIPAGNITMGALYEVMPFDNILVTMDLTGTQVLQVLNWGIGNRKIGSVQFSGLRVICDSSRPEGQQVLSVTLPDGSPLDLNRIYKVVTNDFMAAGGDQYDMFKDGQNRTDTFVPLREALIEAVKKTRVIDFQGDNRLFDVHAPAAAPAA